MERAKALHRSMLTFDAHIDVCTEPPPHEDRFSVDRALGGGLCGAALTVHATARHISQAAEAQGRKELERRYAIIQGMLSTGSARCARTPGEFRRIAAEGQFAVVLSLQNAAPFAADLAELAAWARRGVRILAFNFIGNNQWSDSARPYPYFGGDLQSGGLTPLGKQGVQRLNDLGVIVDVSQSSSEAFSDILATTRAPVIASHSDVRALVDTDRNFSDEELQALKRNGGVIHLVAFGPYLRTPNASVLAQLSRLWVDNGLQPPRTMSDFLSLNDVETRGWAEGKFWRFLHEFHEILDLEKPHATLGDFVAAIDHAVDVIGIDHVGISSDFNHGGGVRGWRDVSQTAHVTAALIERGYSDQQIAKMWSGNFLRVWEQVEQARAGAFRE